jgi:hypothetical protein
MNERTEELAKQAAEYAIEFATQDQEQYIPKLLEKFAELIVRECANRLRETDYELMFVEDGMCDPSISDAMLVAASDIEEHLGVDNGE